MSIGHGACCGQCKWWDYRGVREDWNGDMRDYGRCLNPTTGDRNIISDVDDLCAEFEGAGRDENIQ